MQQRTTGLQDAERSTRTGSWLYPNERKISQNRHQTSALLYPTRLNISKRGKRSILLILVMKREKTIKRGKKQALNIWPLTDLKNQNTHELHNNNIETGLNQKGIHETNARPIRNHAHTLATLISSSSSWNLLFNLPNLLMFCWSSQVTWASDPSPLETAPKSSLLEIFRLPLAES